MEEILRSGRIASVRSDIRGEVYQEALRMISAGTEVLRLNTGNPPVFGFGMPESIRRALLENLDRTAAYCDLKGMPASRDAICEYETGKGLPGLSPDHIFIGNGVSELAPMLCAALFNAGDEVLLPSPNYSLWSNSALLADAKPVFYRCDESAGWYPDTDDLRAKITKRTRAILVINPNNPTGALYPKEVLEQIVALAREYGLILISDEIYDRLVMDGQEHLSTASLAPDLFCVTLNGLSKSHSVCGFRCGWMCFSGAVEKGGDVLDGVVQLAAMRLCANAPAQVAIPAALADMGTPRAMIIPGGRLYEQREAAASALGKIEGLSFVKNTGAFYLFPKLSKEKFGITDDRRFARDLLLAKHILIVPGSGFDYPEPDHFRIVLLPEAPVLKQAMEDIGDFLDGYHQ